ncbi:MAG: phosphomannomutase/phosphoglucomutase, partial [Acidimicrobiales bacterium]
MTDTTASVLDDIVKAYDIRGVFPEQIDAAVCAALGTGFAAFLRTADPDVSAVVIARDMRPSGPELVDAFASGVQAQGLDVVDVGLGSTDLLYFASGTLGLPGAMFTASHNPAEYNGIKLCRAGAAPIGEDSGLDDIKRYALDPPGWNGPSGGRRSDDLLGDFANHVRSFIDTNGLRPLKVIADTANGMGGLVVPEVFAELPFDLEVLYPELDGTFPNHEANPIQPENLVDLQARVLETGADIGLAFDGDADRVFLVDETAAPVSG